MPRSAVLDGEIVCLDKKGRPAFNDLLFRRGEPFFVAFDVLNLNGKDLRPERLLDRKHELRNIIAGAALFVLAEIALVLLFSFLAILMPAYAKLKRTADEKAQPAAGIGKLQQERQRLEKENADLRKILDVARRTRSIATPSCAELGKASDWLFVATIRGPDRFDVDGRPYTLQEVLAAHSSAMEQAKADGCIHRIKLFYGVGVSVSDYDYALRRIEEYFYTKKLGPQA